MSVYDGVMLVDTQPVAANHLLWSTDYPGEEVLAAIDHHPPRRSQLRARVHDVRPEVGASSTLLCEYLAVAEVPIDTRLATALFYGIKSDTMGLSRHTSALDIWGVLDIAPSCRDGSAEPHRTCAGSAHVFPQHQRCVSQHDNLHGLDAQRRR